MCFFHITPSPPFRSIRHWHRYGTVKDKRQFIGLTTQPDAIVLYREENMKSVMAGLLMAGLFLLLGLSVCRAKVLTVGSSGQYATPCHAIQAAHPGDTIEINYNKGIPYHEPPDQTHGNRSDCVWYTNNLTIVGVHGRPILDASGEIIQEGILVPHGADLVIGNLELRNASTPPGQGDNGAGIKIEGGTVNSPAGGNVTIQFCYIHNNEDGILAQDIGPGSGRVNSPMSIFFTRTRISRFVTTRLPITATSSARIISTSGSTTTTG